MTTASSRPPTHLAAVAALLTAAGLLTAAALAPAAQAAPAPAPAALSASATKASFAKVQARLNGPAGVVVFVVGAAEDEQPLIQVGSFTTGVAWSTSKVPVTVAALARSSSSTTRSRARAAITRSDNTAAKRLRESLGSAPKADARIQAVIRAAGDRRTVVGTKKTPPGLTPWRLDDQARFAAGLACLPQGKATVKLMGEVIPEQRFGLGRLKGSAIKGGWGPVSNGYLTRQLAIITMADGTQFGVSVAVRTVKGFDRGKSDLARVADWVAPQLAARDGGRCLKA